MIDYLDSFDTRSLKRQKKLPTCTEQKTSFRTAVVKARLALSPAGIAARNEQHYATGAFKSALARNKRHTSSAK